MASSSSSAIDNQHYNGQSDGHLILTVPKFPSPVKRSWQRSRPIDEEADLSSYRMPVRPPATLQLSLTKSESIKSEAPRAFFDKISQRTPCVFICHGSPAKAYIRQIHLKEDDDQAAIFRKMNIDWGTSKNRLPFRKVAKVEEVTFRFFGAEMRKDREVFLGTYEKPDVKQFCHTLDKELQSLSEKITEWIYNDPSDVCREDYTTGEWEHSPRCHPPALDFPECRVQDYDRLKRCRDSISLLPMLTLAFQKPPLAAGQRLLGGLTQDSGVYSSQDLLRNLYHHDPGIGDVAFCGYKVTEEWDLRHSAFLPLTTATVVGSCVGFRLLFGDWETAITASSLVVAFMALVIQWMIYMARDT